MREYALGSSMRPPFGSAVINALHCRCPNCHKGPLFRGWFNRVLPRCPECGLSYFRESGYYLGGMIVTYVLTTMLLLAIYLVLLLLPERAEISERVSLPLWMGFGVLVALLLVRPCYSLWITLDFWIEPWQPGGTKR